MRYFLIICTFFNFIGCVFQHPGQIGGFRKEKYINHDIGFSLTFKQPWQIFTSPAQIPSDLKQTFHFYQQQNHEVLYMGKYQTADVLAVATASKPSVDLDLYVRIFLALAHGAIETVISREAVVVKDIPMIKLEYIGIMGKDRANHLEYYMDVGGRRVRVIFTASVDLYRHMKPEFERIMRSFESGSGAEAGPGPLPSWQ